MDDKLENVVNELQHNSALKAARDCEKAKAYHEGYAQGIEDLYRVLRQNGVKIKEE